MKMTLRRRVAGLLLAAAVAAAPMRVVAEDFTTSTVMSTALSKECLDYCIIGVCIWLICTPFGCWTETTAKISHNLPDLVVTSFKEPGKDPWDGMRSTLGSVGNSIGQGANGSLLGGRLEGGNMDDNRTDKTTNLKFKEVDVTGDPAATAYSYASMGFMCKTKSIPFFPYFQSILDAYAWRTGVTDAIYPASYIPGLREIGDWPLKTWGNVYARTGFLIQTDDSKAAAVMAQRAIDIVTRTRQPHVYVPYATNGWERMTWGDPNAKTAEACKKSQGAWMPDENGMNGDDNSKSSGTCRSFSSMENMPPSNEKNDKWQMISPTPESTCGPFGDDSRWGPEKHSAKGTYGWVYWRPYECCIPGPGMLLTTVDLGKVWCLR